MTSSYSTLPWSVAALALCTAVSTHAQDIRLGVHTTLSGPASTWGKAMVGAAELAAEDANSKGGLEVAGKKHKIVVTAYDESA
jgi:branched-chain amino acid transport system substrate-binding protein